ncbi:hypothetical protein Syun_022026 [Stephania yunnanensis]|uniref:O-methyltransferase C-terminal domain-containing protein n=1 Tax=Stephania yunnanensis TaxID=152371 RepID=A0AAP0IGP9_9MAGN
MEAHVWVALRNVVQLGIQDLIHDHPGGAMTLREIASKLSFEDAATLDEPVNLDSLKVLPRAYKKTLDPSNNESSDCIEAHEGNKIFGFYEYLIASALFDLIINVLNVYRLNRTMRFMVHINLFTTTCTGETKYGLTPASMLLLKSGLHKSLAKFVMLQTDPQQLSMAARLVESLRGTENCLELVHGMDRTNALDVMAEDAEFTKMTIDAMNSGTECMVEAFVEGLKREKIIDNGVTSLVDVGGNSGTVAKAMLNSFPHMKCSVMESLHIVEMSSTMILASSSLLRICLIISLTTRDGHRFS